MSQLYIGLLIVIALILIIVFFIEYSTVKKKKEVISNIRATKRTVKLTERVTEVVKGPIGLIKYTVAEGILVCQATGELCPFTRECANHQNSVCSLHSTNTKPGCAHGVQPKIKMIDYAKNLIDCQSRFYDPNAIFGPSLTLNDISAKCCNGGG